MKRSQPRASILFRAHRYYRRELFETGLKRIGYAVSLNPVQLPGERDVLVLWNRPRSQEPIAKLYERRGGTVFVVENSYIGDGQFAMAVSQHNGAGRWREGGPERWEAMNIELKPWRKSGDFVLVLPQRGIGPVGVGMPAQWKDRAVRTLARTTKREVRVRPHPGNDKAEPYQALENAWAAVTWASGAAIKALVAGIPVFHEFPKWIGAPAAAPFGTDIEKPFLGDRLPMFRRLAWAQYYPADVESGWPFLWLTRR